MEPSPPQQRVRRRRFRRLLRIAIVAMVIVLLLAAAVQGVLWSDIPRTLVLDAISRSTGLRCTASSVSVRWGGTTVVRDLSIAVPLADDPLVTVPVVTASHRSLLMLALTRSVGLHHVEIDGARLRFIEDEQGEINLEQALRAWKAAKGTDGTSDGPPELPGITVARSAISVERAGRGVIEIPIAIAGTRRDPREIELNASLGTITVEGRLSSVGWEHDLSAVVPDDALLRALIPETPPLPQPVAAHARWRGRQEGEGFAGTLTVRHAEVGPTSLRGTVVLRADAGFFTADLEGIELHDGRVPGGEVRLARGELRLAGETLEATRLGIEGMGLAASVDGTWQTADRTAEIRARWGTRDTALSVQHSGTLEAGAAFPEIGSQSFRLALTSDGWAGARRWTGQATVDGAGPTWTTLAGQLSIPTLRVEEEGKNRREVSDIVASWNADWPMVRITEASVPGATRAEVRAEIDVASREWTLALECTEWLIPGLSAPILAAAIDAHGDVRRIEVREGRIETTETSISLSGTLDADRETPVLAHTETRVILPPASGNDPEPEAEPAFATIVLDIEGSLEPLDLVARGRAETTPWPVAAGILDATTFDVNAYATTEGVRAHAATKDLLGGAWQAEARIDAASTDAEVRVVAEGVPLDRGIALVVPPLRVAGVLGADVTLRAPKLDLNRLEAGGVWTVTDGTYDQWQGLAGSGKLDYREGRVRVDEVLLANGAAQVAGVIEFDASNASTLNIDLETRAWPVALEPADVAALVDSRVRLAVDIAERAASGPVELSAAVAVRGQPVGTVAATGAVDGRTIEASRLQAALLGGNVVGAARVPLDSWLESTAELSVTDLDLSRLQTFGVSGQAGAGIVSGRLVMGPASDPRAIEPLRIGADLSVESGRLGPLRLGDLSLVVHGGPKRWVAEIPSMEIAGGKVRAWSRLSWHGDEPFTHVNLVGEGLQLNEFVAAANPGGEPVPGLLTMQAAFGGYIHHPRRAYGEAEVTLEESDLGALPVLTQLYGLLNVRGGSSAPRGRGAATLRLEGDTLRLAGLHYYNRGTDVLATAEMANLWQGMESPIRGSAAGAVRPLADSGLPFSQRLDRMFRAATSKAVSVRIGGTAGEPEVATVPLTDAAPMLNRLLGDTQKE